MDFLSTVDWEKFYSLNVHLKLLMNVDYDDCGKFPIGLCFVKAKINR